MLQEKLLAVITHQSLINLGLKQLLCQYFSPLRVDIFRNADEFLASSPENYDLYFVFSETFLTHGDFFIPRKNKTILLTELGRDKNKQQFITQLNIGADENEIVECIEEMIHSLHIQSASEPQEELSPREIEVLKLIAKGYINKEIAEELNISFNTVLTHRKNITSKLGIKTVSGLSFFAMMNGYISVNAKVL